MSRVEVYDVLPVVLLVTVVSFFVGALSSKADAKKPESRAAQYELLISTKGDTVTIPQESK